MDYDPQAAFTRKFVLGTPTTSAYGNINDSDEEPTTTLTPGGHYFPFQMDLSPGNSQLMPASFKTDHGRIYYVIIINLVSYIPSVKSWRWKMTGRREIKCHGFSRISPSLSAPLSMILKKETSFFTRKTQCKVDLILENGVGYVWGDEIVCQILIENKALDTIEEIAVVFGQRIVYIAERSKTTVAVLSEKRHDCGCGESEVEVTAIFTVPGRLMPTYSDGQKSIDISYYIQVEVKRKGKSSVKGATTIIIGTTRVGEASPSHLQRRVSRISIGSGISRISLQSCSSTASTLPPSYSTLSSRRHSLETLPPIYDDIEKDYLQVCGPMYSSASAPDVNIVDVPSDDATKR